MKACVPVPALEGDDVGFIHAVRETLSREPGMTDETYLIKLDSWFGSRWLQFSGKILGALGVWKVRRPTLPPFHPSRVVFERHFEFDRLSSSHVETVAPQTLHVRQTSANNMGRYVNVLSNSATFVWYSGDTQRTGRGSVMTYVTKEADHDEWYIEIIRSNGVWHPTKPRHRDAMG